MIIMPYGWPWPIDAAHRPGRLLTPTGAITPGTPPGPWPPSHSARNDWQGLGITPLCPGPASRLILLWIDAAKHRYDTAEDFDLITENRRIPRVVRNQPCMPIALLKSLHRHLAVV